MSLIDIDPLQAELERRFYDSAKEAALLAAALMRVRQAAPLGREFWNHDLDLYYQWKENRNPLWVERGVFNSLVLKTGGKVLDLACGDGFNARNFYSLRAAHVTACDIDELAIEHARIYNDAMNVSFLVADIVTAMPEGKFDNVILDAAIEHLKVDEIGLVLRGIKERLTGIFSGYTVIDAYHVPEHETYFSSAEDLHKLLKQYFVKVRVFETVYPDRHNLYWWASDGAALPFGAGWKNVL